MKTCSTEGCNKSIYAKGLCISHYLSKNVKERIERNFKNNILCTVEGCNRPLYANGLCSTHYSHRINKKRIAKNIKERKLCTVEGCNKTQQDYVQLIIHIKLKKRRVVK